MIFAHIYAPRERGNRENNIFSPILQKDKDQNKDKDTDLNTDSDKDNDKD